MANTHVVPQETAGPQVREASMKLVFPNESEQWRTESQWIVVAMSLCHLQYSIAYFSHRR